MTIQYGSDLDPTHILEGNITCLFGDFRDELNPKAVMGVELFLISLNDRSSKVVFSELYKETIVIHEASAENLIRAYCECLQQILLRFEADLNNSFCQIIF